jgi:predicted Rossmann fold nucleotide-binding protein DprA/Smf involved in DNA uptake
MGKVVAVIGSRSINQAFVFRALDEVIQKEKIERIISGGAKGVDSHVREYCMQNNINFWEFLPEYAKFGRIAPHIRNKLIIDYADKVIAIWDGKSKGTKSVIERSKGKVVTILAEV